MTVEKLKEVHSSIAHYCHDCMKEYEHFELVKIMTNSKHTSFILCKKCVQKMYEMAKGVLGE